jgi:hypothetical protein
MTTPAVLVLTCSLDELRALVRDEVRAALAEHTPAPVAPYVDRRELARLLDVSPATVTRLAGEGMPCTHVGDSPRYVVAEVRAWLATRGRTGTTAAPARASIAGVRLLSRGAR